MEVNIQVCLVSNSLSFQTDDTFGSYLQSVWTLQSYGLTMNPQ